MLSLGQRFRQKREQQKISLDAVAERTKINPRYLQAIETENFEDLPAGLFRRSFVRQYADALNLSDPALEEELDELIGTAEASRDPVRDWEPPIEDAIDVDPLPTPPEKPDGEHRMAWAVGLLIFALVSCSAIYALWEHTQVVLPRREAALASQPPPAETNPVTAQDLNSAPPPVSPEPPAMAEPPMNSALASQSVQSEPPKPQPVQQETPEAARLKALPSEPIPTEASPPPPEKLDPKPSRIVVQVSANERVWVRMTADHQTVFRGMLDPQERRSFEGTERTRVLVGDAGAVNVIWNGKPIGAIGRSGQIRVIEFTPDTFRILSP